MTLPRFDARFALFVALFLVGVFYISIVLRALREQRRAAEATSASSGSAGVRPGLWLLLTGFVTNFFDTLGIGSFATTTSIFRQWKLVRDEQIPATLNVGHTLPTIVQAFIYTTIVPVETRTLVLMIAAAVLGAWLGAGVVARWPRQRIQVGMGAALLAAAGLLAAQVLAVLPSGGSLLALTGMGLVIGLTCNFALGALMTIGIGLYAPCLILVSMLGMNPTTGFPIMMGSCAFLMPIASARFLRAGAADVRASLGLMLGGLPAVLIAAFIVKTLPLPAVRWLVVVVVVYTSVNLLRTALRERGAVVAKVEVA